MEGVEQVGQEPNRSQAGDRVRGQAEPLTGVAAARQFVRGAARRLTLPERLSKYQARFYRVWSYIGIGAIIMFVFWLADHVSDAIFVLVLGSVLAFIYAPITNTLERRFHVPRLLGTFVGLALVIAFFVMLIGLIIPLLSRQLVGMLQSMPTYIDMISNAWNDLNVFLGSEPDGVVQSFIISILDNLASQVTKMTSGVAQNAAAGVFSGVSSIVTTVIDVFMAFVLSFWLAKDFPGIESEISTVVGPRRGEDYRIITTVFSRSLSGYLKGLIINSACTGVIAGVGYWLLGVPYATLLGLITAILNIIPYVGPWTGGALAFLVGISVGPMPAILSIVVTVAAQQFTDNVISPKVMQAAVSLHPALVIVAMLAGAALGGIGGMIAAVPLTAAFKGVFVYYFEKKTGRQLMSKNGMLFRGETFTDEHGNPRPACDALGFDITGDEGVPERIRTAMAAASVPEEARAGHATAVDAGHASAADDGRATAAEADDAAATDPRSSR